MSTGTAKHIRTGISQNGIFLDKDKVFFAAGMRFNGYDEGEWLVRFTPDKSHAEEYCRQERLKHENHWSAPGNQIQFCVWEIRLRDGEVFGKESVVIEPMKPGESIL